MVHYEAHTFGSFGNCTYGGDDMRSNPGTPTLNTMERPLSTDTKSTTALHDPPVPVRAKLAAAWTSFMFLYIYVDYFALYKPGVVDDILDGVVFEFDISQTLLTLFLTSIAIPIFMILLSTTLPTRINRAANLVVASLSIPFAKGVQRGRRVLDLLLRPLHRTRGVAPGLHPALRLDLAPHRTVGDHGDQDDNND